MTLVIDERSSLAGQPAMHALIVGVSAYPDLPGPGETLLERHYGMRRLSSAALAAFHFYRWLEANQGDLPAKLATCRLLLSPSQDELQAEPRLAGLAGRATLQSFLAEASEWREDASLHRDGMTCFYFAGHGVHRDRENSVLLLEGFGSGIGGTLVNGFDLGNLRGGMAPTDNRPEIARTQLYFVDACRTMPSKFRDLPQLTPTQVFTPDQSGVDDRTDPVFYATAAGSETFGRRGEGSVFSKALIECLEGDAGDLEDLHGTEEWVVTLHRLTRALKAKYEDLNAANGTDLFFDPSGTSRDARVCRLPGRPSVEIVFMVDPETALPGTRITFRDMDPTAQLRLLPKPLEPHPHRLKVPAGYYTIHAELDPPDPARTIALPGGGQPRPVLPPRVVKRVTVR